MIHMHHLFQSFVDFIRKPEWVAAIALLIQAIILWLQARILHKHGETMKEHVGIAQSQATTAELIGKALTQHEKILADQTAIMQEQFHFHRTTVAQVERAKIYIAVLELHTNIQRLANLIEETPRNSEMENRVWFKLLKAVPPCQEVVFTSIHLTPEERAYFGDRYLSDAADLSEGTTFNTKTLREFVSKYKEFPRMLSKLTQPSPSMG